MNWDLLWRLVLLHHHQEPIVIASTLLVHCLCFSAVLPLPVADLMLFDEQGNKTTVPNKERQVEALQLLLQLLPQANRSLLRLLLDLLHHTARHQDRNKMSAFNLALMFAPHVLWPRHVRLRSSQGAGPGRVLLRDAPGCLFASEPLCCVLLQMNAVDLKDNLDKLNSSMAFLIKHSQKLFRVMTHVHTHTHTPTHTVFRDVTGNVVCVRLRFTCVITPDFITVGSKVSRPR